MRPEITVENETYEVLFARYRDTGDEQAFSMLYDAFGQRLFAIGVRFFRTRCGDGGARAMASDAAQETWARIIGRKDQWSGSPGSFGAWVIAIHFHCLLEMARRVPRRDGAADAERGAPMAGPERRFLAREALEHLSDRLSPEESEVLAVYYLTGHRNLVAASLGISDVALRKRVERIKEGLRNDPRFGELFDEFAFNGHGRMPPTGGDGPDQI